MGTTSEATNISLSDALFPRVRQRVLGLLYGKPHRAFFTNEVIKLAESGRGAVQRELADLAAAGLLLVSSQGNQKQYRANTDAPIFQELRSIVLKTFGLADTLREALGSLADAIDAAFVFGSVAKQQDTATSDVDVMIVSATLGYGDVFGVLEHASLTLGRAVNPTVYTPAQFRKRSKEDNAFIQRVLAGPKLWLIGTEESVNALAS